MGGDPYNNYQNSYPYDNYQSNPYNRSGKKKQSMDYQTQATNSKHRPVFLYALFSAGMGDQRLFHPWGWH